MRILALDVGRKRIGVAMSDPMGIIAQGVKVIDVKDDENSIREIGDIVKENSVEEILIGLPLNMNGTQGPMAKEALEFAEKMKGKISVPVKMWDERLTSLQIEKDLIFMDVSRQKRKKINDMLAAQILLQNYLDSKK